MAEFGCGIQVGHVLKSLESLTYWGSSYFTEIGAWDGLHIFEDSIIGAAHTQLTFWDEKSQATLRVPSTINCLQAFEGRFYVGTGKHGVIIVDGGI